MRVDPELGPAHIAPMSWMAPSPSPRPGLSAIQKVTYSPSSQDGWTANYKRIYKSHRGSGGELCLFSLFVRRRDVGAKIRLEEFIISTRFGSTVLSGSGSGSHSVKIRRGSM